MRLSTITATYVKRRKQFRVLIRPPGGRRISRTVKSEADAIALVRLFNRLGLAGVDLRRALSDAQLMRAEQTAAREPLRDALPAFLDEMVRIGEIRKSTAKGYKNRLAVWAYPAIGDVAWNELTRERIGEVLVKLRAAGRSLACLEQIRCPLTRFFQWQINAKGYKGPNPAADLKFFLGRQPSPRSRKRDLAVVPSGRGPAPAGRLPRAEAAVVRLPARLVRRRAPVGRSDGPPALGHRLAPRTPPRAADVVGQRWPG